MTKKMNHIKILGLTCVAILSMGLITGCGSKDTKENDTPDPTVTEGVQDPGTKEKISETTKPEASPVQPDKADKTTIDEKDASKGTVDGDNNDREENTDGDLDEGTTTDDVTDEGLSDGEDTVD